MATAADAAQRCAVHPSLPAVNACPVCARPRCAADSVTARGGGCLACEGRKPRTGPPPLDLRAVVAAGCVAGLVAPVAGMIASQYVGAGIIGWLVPGFVGIVVSIAAEYGAGKRRGPALRVVAALYSVVSVAVGFQSPRAADSPFELRWLPHYAIAAAVSWLWTVPPRVKKKPADAP